MGIAGEIARVEREFISGELLLAALVQQEGVSKSEVIRWLRHNSEELKKIPALFFNRDLRNLMNGDGAVIDIIGDDYCASDDDIDWEGLTGYVFGWLSPDIKRFLLSVGLNFPESEIERLQKKSNTQPGVIKAAAESTIDTEIDPSDLPIELDAANMAYRAVLNGHGDKRDTFKNRLIDYLQKNFTELTDDAVKRIATVANPDKNPGRKKRDRE